MDNLLNIFAIQFTSLFFTIDVLGLVPIFISLTAEYKPLARQKIIKRGVFTAFAVLMFFGLMGIKILDLFGISLAAFRIAGGLLLLIMAIELVLDKPDANICGDDSQKGSDISVFPLAIPFLSGPASISMLIIFMKQAEHNLVRHLIVMGALFINMVLCYFILSFSTHINKLLKKSGINVLNRIFGIILTAMACQFIINGIIEAFNISVK